GLVLGDRPGLADRHHVALTGFVVLVVRKQLRAAADELAVHRMLDVALDDHGDGLVHLVAGHAAGQRTDDFLLFAHDASPAFIFSFSTVLTRAMFLRTFCTWSGRASWPVAFCMRRLNCSLRRSNSSSCSSFIDFVFSSCAFITSPAASRRPS